MERIEICLNYEKLVDCDNTTQFEACHGPHFIELEDEAWVIRKL